MKRHGKVLRYDTHGDFHDPASWAAYDASATDGLRCMGYYGAAFDGRFVIFPPRRDPEGFHARALRYDTHGDFHDPASWSAHDAEVENSSQSAAFDGRYLYFNPGQRAEQRTAASADDNSPKVTGFSVDQVLIASGNLVRYDTRGDFRDPASWAAHDVDGTDGLETRDFDGSCFDGRYVYLAPLAYAAALRYDSCSGFDDPESWQAYDCAARFGMKRNVGVIFDGQYVYYVPYGACPVAVRFNTAGDFHDDAAWEAYAFLQTPGAILGFDGACFDGRYVVYIPYYDEGTVAHGVFLRYDTQGAFADPASWSTHDATCTDGLFTRRLQRRSLRRALYLLRAVAARFLLLRAHRRRRQCPARRHHRDGRRLRPALLRSRPQRRPLRRPPRPALPRQHRSRPAQHRRQRRPTGRPASLRRRV